MTYFDVTVNSHLHGEGFWAANVTACYVRPHPDANPDGTTRVSTDPWSVLVERPNGSLVQVPVSHLSQTDGGTAPQYTEDLLSVGQCQTGWITVTPPGNGTFAGMKYAPRDFPNDTVTWQWSTMMKTVTPSVTATADPPETPSTARSAAPDRDSTPGIDFDRAYAIDVAGDMIRDINTVDHRLRDGIAVSSGLWLLSSEYGRLENAGTPPGVDAAKYHARLRTLDAFASAASDIYDNNPTEGAAGVCRRSGGDRHPSQPAELGARHRPPASLTAISPTSLA